MSDVVGDRGCIYPEGVCRGHWPKGALEAEKSEGKRKGVPRCPSTVPHPNGPRLLCSFIFFLLQTGFFVPISVPLAPTTSPKPVTHGPLEVPQLVAPEGSARSASSTLDPLRSPRGNVNAETQARADKQAPGHTGPQPEARQAGHRESAVPAASPSPALKTEASASPMRSPEDKDLEETGHWTRPQAHQTLTPFCCPGGACGGQEVTQVQSPGGYRWPHLQGSHPQPS